MEEKEDIKMSEADDLDVKKLTIEPLGRNKETRNPDSLPEKHGKFKMNNIGISVCSE